MCCNRPRGSKVVCNSILAWKEPRWAGEIDVQVIYCTKPIKRGPLSQTWGKEGSEEASGEQWKLSQAPKEEWDLVRREEKGEHPRQRQWPV